MSGDYSCPYPGCEWCPSRPVTSDVRLTQTVVEHEIEQHREKHTEGGPEDSA